MNEQKLFDASLKHMRAQGEQSADSGTAGTCQYRNPEGLECAFAPAIKFYDRGLEGRSAIDLLEYNSEALYKEYREIDKVFALDLQMAHDDWDEGDTLDFLPFFEERMNLIAEKHKLEYNK